MPGASFSVYRPISSGKENFPEPTQGGELHWQIQIGMLLERVLVSTPRK